MKPFLVKKAGQSWQEVLVSPKGDQFPMAVKLTFPCTNNVTEYEACLRGLQAALEMNIRDLEVYGDSMLIIRQAQGEWERLSPKLMPYSRYFLELIGKFRSIRFEHTYRDSNQQADALATLAAMSQIIPEFNLANALLVSSKNLFRLIDGDGVKEG